MPDPKKMLSWTHEDRLCAFQNMDALYATTPVAHDPENVLELGVGPRLNDIAYRFDNQNSDLGAYLERRNVVGFLVLKDGRIRCELYREGVDSASRWTAWSVGKSVVSTLVGIAVEQGAVGAVDDLITAYVPELVGSGYEGTTIRNLMQMSSGVRWSEDPSAPGPNVGDFARCLASREPGSVLRLARSMTRSVEPGTRWNYNNIDAFLVGLALERATGQSLAANLEEHVWKPFGMEQPASWMAESEGGINSGAGDFSATLRDYGRMGMFVLNEGALSDGRRKLPSWWLADACSWAPHSAEERFPAARPGKYGYFWWHRPVDPGRGASPERTESSNATFAAVGRFGQYVFLNQAENLVMVQWSVYDGLPLEEAISEPATLFNAISNALG